MKVAVVLTILLGAAWAVEYYSHYKVLELFPKTKEQTDWLREVQLADPNLDFWDEVTRVGYGSIKVMLSPEKYHTFAVKLRDHQIPFKVINHNVQDQVTAEFMRLQAKRNFDINDFNSFEDITEELERLVGICGDNGLTCTKSKIGDTYEENDIEMIHISSGSGRPAVWLDATIHSREWLATATCLKILDHLINNYGSDDDVTTVIDSYDWYIVPVNNPDGYIQTWEGDRYWRKNRSPNSGSSCLGTDLNRNFPFRWGMEGISTNPCSQLFCGPSGGSEAETQAVMNAINDIRESQEIRGLVTIHSYGLMWMHPWGNTIGFLGGTCERAEDHDDMYAVAAATADAMQAEGGLTWARGTSCEVIYATTGATDDWAKAVAGIKYPFTPELRGTDFVISNTQIDPSFREVFAGLVEMCATMQPPLSTN